MKKLSLSLICIICAFILAIVGCTKEPEILLGSITGIVTDASNGSNPLQGVSVQLTNLGLSTNTGSDGKYSFKDLEPGSYSILFSKSGYINNTRSTTVIAGIDATCDTQLEKEMPNLLLSPTSLNFGTTQTELSITITNEGTIEADWSLDLGSHQWLTASPIQGRITSKNKQSVVFKVDRSKVSSETSVIVKVNAGGSSFPLTISCSPILKKAEMSIDPVNLNFGNESTEQSFTITNTGNATLNWNTKNISSDCITLSDTQGTIAENGNKTIKVFLDRSKLSANLNTSFIISDGTKEESISVSAIYVKPQGVLNIPTSSFDFGETYTELPLTLENKGNALLKWNIQGLSENSITLSDTSGEIPVGGNSVVQIKLNRATMPDNLNTTFIVSDGTKQKTVTIKATKAKAVLSVSPVSLDFGESAKSLQFTISNTGTTELSWSIKDISSACLSVTPMSGNIPANSSKEITVNLDRDSMTEDINAIITVQGANKEEKVTIVAKKASAMSNVVVSSGLTAYYQFESNFNDLTENGNNGFGMNEPTFVDGISDNSTAIKFNSGNNSYIQIPKSVGDSKTLTITFWGKDFSDGGIFYVLNANNKAIATLSIHNGALKYLTGYDQNYYHYESSLNFTHPKITDNTWHHIAICMTSGNFDGYCTKTTLYIDGNMVDEIKTGELRNIGEGKKLIIGGAYQSYYHSVGATNMTIDNFRIYNSSILKNSDIKTIYNAKQ